MPPKPTSLQPTGGFAYHALADRIETQIRDGGYPAGQKLPSVRSLHAKTRLSITTVHHALIELERRGLVAARPKSGYYVNPLPERLLPPPQTRPPRLAPSKISINNWAFAVLEAMRDPRILQLGGSVMAPQLMPGKLLAHCLKSTRTQKLVDMLATYEDPLGHADLRRQIAQRDLQHGLASRPDEILITNGCFEAVAICLQAVARHGDTIVVESPTFPWYLQLIEDLGMYALEIPTDPKEGIDLVALEKAVEGNRVNACIFNSNFQNPLGFVADDEKKEALVRLLNQKEIPLIEDDIYGELYFGPSRPITLKAFDTKGLVLYCASFSKTVSPSLRIGWTLPGRFTEKVRHLKLYTSIASPSLTQHVMSEYLKTGGFDRHLRKLRTVLHHQMAATSLAIARHFPFGTRLSTPEGGLTLWVQLREGLDSMALFRKALEAKIAVLPGLICAGSDSYRHCIRISSGLPFTSELDQGLQRLARIVHGFYE